MIVVAAVPDQVKRDLVGLADVGPEFVEVFEHVVTHSFVGAKNANAVLGGQALCGIDDHLDLFRKLVGIARFTAEAFDDYDMQVRHGSSGQRDQQNTD